MSARILVVDDEPDLELLIVQRFRKHVRDGSFSFAFAQDGENALAVLADDPAIDMVVTDINMPRMDGLTLLGRLLEREDHLATIIVSAYGDMANIRTAMNRGAFDFLTKPIDFGDLETTIAKTLRTLEITRGYQRRQQAAERARAQLSRYFSPSLADRLAEATEDIDLGAQRRDVTSMFTDIAGFTTLAESLDPGLIAPLLNEYLAGMTGIVFDHAGTLVKISGDALNVLFGAPTEQPDHAARGVACAMALDTYAEEFRTRWRAKGVAFGITRIGINSGPALVGNFGGGRFFDYNAHGDTINTAGDGRVSRRHGGLGVRVAAVGVHEGGMVPAVVVTDFGGLVLQCPHTFGGIGRGHGGLPSLGIARAGRGIRCGFRFPRRQFNYDSAPRRAQHKTPPIYKTLFRTTVPPSLLARTKARHAVTNHQYSHRFPQLIDPTAAPQSRMVMAMRNASERREQRARNETKK